jgi:hypothetical protein
MTVDEDFYYSIYGGTEYSGIDRLLKRAENEIDRIILRSPHGESETREYSFAVCAQAEYIGLCGGIEAWAASASGTAASFSVGSFSMSRGGSSSESSSCEGVSGRALEYLSRSGLLYRGCAVW